MLFTRLRTSLFCFRSPIRQYQTSTRLPFPSKPQLATKSQPKSNRPSATPRSGINWTHEDLKAFNISLTEETPLEFFGVRELPEPRVDPEILSVVEASEMQDIRNGMFITFLDYAMRPDMGKSAVVDFSVRLLEITGYLTRRRVARTRVDLKIEIGGLLRHTKTNVCLVDANEILLLIQPENKMPAPKNINVRAQVVAEAAAGFVRNNVQKINSGLPPLLEKLMPGIIMVGTTPTFFKIPVTQSLVDYMRKGTCPPQETCVTYCFPPIPLHLHQGMKPLDNRRAILKCYEALKKFVIQ